MAEIVEKVAVKKEMVDSELTWTRLYKDHDHRIAPFLRKLAAIVALTPPDVGGFSAAGDEFCVQNVIEFQKLVSKCYPSATYATFVRQLQFYGFSKTQDSSMLKISHRLFRRDSPALFLLIKRNAKRKQETRQTAPCALGAESNRKELADSVKTELCQLRSELRSRENELEEWKALAIDEADVPCECSSRKKRKRDVRPATATVDLDFLADIDDVDQNHLQEPLPRKSKVTQLQTPIAATMLYIFQFTGVSETEASAVLEMQQRLSPEATTQLPADVGGDVALLRWIRSHGCDIDAAVEGYLNCLASRAQLDLGVRRKVLLEPNGALKTEHEIPELEDYLRLTCFNSAFAVTRHGDIAKFIDCASLDIPGLVAFDDDEYSRCVELSREFEGIAVDRSSRRQKRVASLVQFWDMGGVKLEHVRLIGKFRRGFDACQAIGPPNFAATNLVMGLGSVGRAVFKPFVMCLPKHVRTSIQLLGSPLTPGTREQLSTLFDLASLPKAIGGDSSRDSRVTSPEVMEYINHPEFITTSTAQQFDDVELPMRLVAFDDGDWECDGDWE